MTKKPKSTQMLPSRKAPTQLSHTQTMTNTNRDVKCKIWLALSSFSIVIAPEEFVTEQPPYADCCIDSPSIWLTPS